MNTAALENLLTRRSIRHYKPTQVSEDALNAVLEAGVYAPTGKGLQSPLMVVVQNPDDIAELSKLNALVWGRDADPFYGAPTVIVVLARQDSPFGVQDACLVMGNLMNAAHAAGLGSCWINRAREVFDMPEGKAILKRWGVGNGWTGVGNCILGYTDGEVPAPKPRKPDYYIRIK